MIEEWLRGGAFISSAPGKVLLGWGKRLWSSHCQNSLQPYFYFPDFFLRSPTPWFTHEYTKEFSFEECLDLLPPLLTSMHSRSWKKASKEIFSHEFALLQDKLER